MFEGNNVIFGGGTAFFLVRTQMSEDVGCVEKDMPHPFFSCHLPIFVVKSKDKHSEGEKRILWERSTDF